VKPKKEKKIHTSQSNDSKQPELLSRKDSEKGLELGPLLKSKKIKTMSVDMTKTHGSSKTRIRVEKLL
jgi:hypothetical protein